MSAVLSLSTPTWQQAIDRLNTEAWDLRDADRNRALELALESKHQAVSHNYQLGLAQSMTVSSFIHFRRNHFSLALSEALNAMALCEDKTWLPKLYNTIAVTYEAIGERTLAIEYLQKQLELCQQSGDRVREAITLHNLALMLTGPDYMQQAIRYYHQAFGIFTEQGEHWGEVLTLLNLADLYNTSPSYYPQALACTQQAIEFSRQYGNVEQGFCLKISGDNYRNQQQYIQALSCYEQSLEHMSDEPSLAVTVWLAIGECQQRLEKPSDAKAALKHALFICESTDYKSMLYTCHEKLSGFYKQQGDLAQALEHFEIFHSLKEHIFNETSEQKTRTFEIVRQNIQHKSEAQQHQNSELKKYIQELEVLHHQVKELSIRDPLTSLYNRRYLFDYLDILKQRDSSLSLAIIDVDHFKLINDTFNHSVGDDVLKGITTLLNMFLRESDIAARHGGEEFVLVFPEASLDQALLACERLRATIETHDWKSEHLGLEVTLSIGLVSGMASDYEKLLAKADQRLYEAKNSGRNCVKI
jgi:diguanylate cyclase (GGDEF)-like protein